jgi:hypothetical protein
MAKKQYQVAYRGINGAQVFTFATKAEQDAFCMGLEVEHDDGCDYSMYAKDEDQAEFERILEEG